MSEPASAAAWRRDPTSAPRPARKKSLFHQRILAEELLLERGGGGLGRVTPTLSTASIDLNPHQLEAAITALESLSSGGCILGDEVGLGKTVEAGLVIGQLISEGRGRILILAPAPLRAQWRDELWDKFGLVSECVDGPSAKASKRLNPFDLPVPVICSVPFAANRPGLVRQIPWDLVVIDEAHRLRNAYRPTHKTGRALREAIPLAPKLLLTATPLQNSLMELFGLVSLIDETILGTEESFRTLYGPLLQPPPPHGAPDEAMKVNERQELMEDLKERLEPIVQRTLRRQVREYVKYTNRRSIVEDFRPSDEEQALYDKVSDYLCREEVAAIAPERRTLLTLCYRKILGSSTFAIASTLERLADGLAAKLGNAKEVARAQAEHMALVLEMEDDQDGIEEEIRRIYEEEAEELLDDRQIGGDRKPMTMEECQAELKELREMAAMARSIQVNAKGEALVRALKRTFSVAAEHDWPQKAVIFTESRRTQNYLRDLLASEGFAGKISILCGDGSGPEERKRLVDEFRNETQILISTEAGAEGLNLQFCNLLINYDLPWNPQRVEQRIGRCHRYGQKRDVLVINMVNRSNAAEARLYELLEQKLSLFDGVFGASDDVLGALDSGVDFERRVLSIYQDCRSEEEIDKAFNSLRAEMEGKINTRMEEARSALMDRFDDQVKSRLRVKVGEAREALRKSESHATDLALSVLGSEADRQGDLVDIQHIPQALLDAADGELAAGLYSLGTAQEAKEAGVRKLGPGSPLVKAAAQVVRQTANEGVTFLALDAGKAPAPLAPLFGKEGWWFVYKLEAGTVEPEQRIVHVVLCREGSVYRSVDPEVGALLVEVPAHETSKRPAGATTSVSTAQENALARAMGAIRQEVEAKRGAEADKARERWDRFTEESLHKARARVEATRAAWESARKAVLACEDPRERTRLRRERDSKERELRRFLDQLRLEEQRRYGDKDRALQDIQKKAAVGEVQRTLLATSYWFLA